MKIKHFPLAVSVVLLLFVVFGGFSLAANAGKITPSKGKVGQTAIVHGSGFSGASVKVKFGCAQAQNPTVLNDKTIKVTVPNKNATDPDPVPVTVEVGGVVAPGELSFDYNPPGPEPAVISYAPEWAAPGTPFSVVVSGTDFTTPQGRIPEQIFLVGPEVVQGSVDFTTITNSTFDAAFPPIGIPGLYEVVVGFSDGAGASKPGFEIWP